MENLMNKHTLALSIVLITISNGFVSTKLLEKKDVQLRKYVRENIELRKKLCEYETEGINVSVTMYQLDFANLQDSVEEAVAGNISSLAIIADSIFGILTNFTFIKVECEKIKKVFIF